MCFGGQNDRYNVLCTQTYLYRNNLAIVCLFCTFCAKNSLKIGRYLLNCSVQNLSLKDFNVNISQNVFSLSGNCEPVLINGTLLYVRMRDFETRSCVGRILIKTGIIL